MNGETLFGKETATGKLPGTANVRLNSEDAFVGMKNPVVQLERTGCAIACVAAITGRSYPEMESIANTLGIFAHDQSLWSDTSYVRRLLDHVGLKADPGEIPFSSWEDLHDLALLSTKWHLEKGRPVWHWAVFVREKGQTFVLDSQKGLRTNLRTDFGRMRPRRYIRVTENDKNSSQNSFMNSPATKRTL